MKRTFVITTILISGCIAAQNSVWQLSYTPALIELPNIRYGLQLGGSYQLNSRLQMLTEFTIATGKPDDPNITNSRYTRIKPELRYMYSNRRAPIKGYLGLQASYANRSWTNSGSGSFYENATISDSAIHFSSANIRTPFATITTQLGGIARISNRISLDVFMGMGARSVFTKYSEITNANKVWSEPAKCRIMFRPDPAWWVNGTLVRFQVNMGVRFFYAF